MHLVADASVVALASVAGSTPPGSVTVASAARSAIAARDSEDDADCDERSDDHRSDRDDATTATRPGWTCRCATAWCGRRRCRRLRCGRCRTRRCRRATAPGRRCDGEAATTVGRDVGGGGGGVTTRHDPDGVTARRAGVSRGRAASASASAVGARWLRRRLRAGAASVGVSAPMSPRPMSRIGARSGVSRVGVTRGRLLRRRRPAVGSAGSSCAAVAASVAEAAPTRTRRRRRGDDRDRRDRRAPAAGHERVGGQRRRRARPSASGGRRPRPAGPSPPTRADATSGIRDDPPTSRIERRSVRLDLGGTQRPAQRGDRLASARPDHAPPDPRASA